MEFCATIVEQRCKAFTISAFSFTDPGAASEWRFRAAFGAAGRTIGCIVRPVFLRLRDRPAHLRGRGQRTPSARDRCTADVERSESGQACALLEAQKHPAGGQSPSGGPTGRSGSGPDGRADPDPPGIPRLEAPVDLQSQGLRCEWRRKRWVHRGGQRGIDENAGRLRHGRVSRFLCVGSIPGGMMVADSDRKGGT